MKNYGSGKRKDVSRKPMLLVCEGLVHLTASTRSVSPRFQSSVMAQPGLRVVP